MDFLEKIKDLLEVSKVKVKKTFLKDIYVWLSKSVKGEKKTDSIKLDLTFLKKDVQTKLISPDEYKQYEINSLSIDIDDEPMIIEEIKLSEGFNPELREYFDGIEKRPIYATHQQNILYDLQKNNAAPDQYQTGTSFDDVNKNAIHTSMTHPMDNYGASSNDLYEKPPETVNFENPKDKKDEEDRLGL